MSNKPYYIYGELCTKIEQDNKYINELKSNTEDLYSEIDYLKDLIIKSDISIKCLIEYLVNNKNLKSSQIKFINKVISKKLEEKNNGN